MTRTGPLARVTTAICQGEMSSAPLVHGLLGSLAVSVLIFLEETGIPLPLVPGDVLLVIGGGLVASGDLNVWAYLPLVIASTLAGALCGYAAMWRLGPTLLRRVAAHVHATSALDRASHRLTNAGARGVFAGRFIPGTRVISTLLAGAVHLPVRTVVAGLAPAVVVWVFALTILGATAGAPVENALLQLDHIALYGGAFAVVAAAGIVAVRKRALRRSRVTVAGAAAYDHPM